MNKNLLCSTLIASIRVSFSVWEKRPRLTSVRLSSSLHVFSAVPVPGMPGMLSALSPSAEPPAPFSDRGSLFFFAALFLLAGLEACPALPSSADAAVSGWRDSCASFARAAFRGFFRAGGCACAAVSCSLSASVVAAWLSAASACFLFLGVRAEGGASVWTAAWLLLCSGLVPADISRVNTVRQPGTSADNSGWSY